MSGLVDSFVAGLRGSAPDAGVRLIDLRDVAVEFCRGCGTVCQLKAGGVESWDRLRERHVGKSRDLGRKVGWQASKA